MADVTTHKRTQRHAAAEAAPRNHHWPLLLIAAPAAVAIWAGWVGLASMCGFGIVHPLPGILDSVRINTAITLPVGVESYGAYALWVWLSGRGSDRTRTWARNSAFAALGLGCLGQVAFHLLAAAHWDEAPWPVVVVVACLPVVTLAFAATLIHMTRADVQAAVAVIPEVTTQPVPEVIAEPAPEGSPVITTEEPAAVMTEEPAEVIPEVTPEVTTRRRRVVPAKATDDELVAIILDAADDPAALTNYKVNKAIKAACGGKGVGETRAARLVDLAQRKHRSRSVVAIGDRRTAP